MSFAISFDDLLAAQSRLKGLSHPTPVLTSKTADWRGNAQIFFKAENLQRGGAFKFRGAANALLQFTPEQRAHGVIAYSSGNHAQAIALSAQLFGMPAVIIMPEDAPSMKVAATRGYGAEVILYDRYTQDREALGQSIARERNLTLIPPFDHPAVMAGQGTAAVELFAETGPLDVLLVPLGGGGLLSGCAVAASRLSPGCRVIGVEPEAGNDVQQSLRAGERVCIATPKTIADGAQTQCVGALTFPVLQSLLSDIVTVKDSDLVAAMGFFAERMKILVEPTGCLGAAALFSGVVKAPGQRVGVILSGGNIDLARFAALIGQSSV